MNKKIWFLDAELDYVFEGDYIDYNKWLDPFKIHLSLSLDDDSRDEALLFYLEIAHKNIWECYYRLDNEFPFASFEALNHPWYIDKITQMAVRHLATVLFQNPDENLEATNVKDDRMIMRILGSRMAY